MTLRALARDLLAAPICLLLCAQTFGQGHLTKTAIAGKEVFVDGYARSDSNCKGLEPPQITIDDPPEHGTICLRRGDLRLKATIENKLAQCLGKKVSGFHIIYLARSNYSGPDRFRYTVQFPTVQHLMDVTLNVWPDRPKASAGAPANINAPTGETRQAPGPIPTCPALVS